LIEFTRPQRLCDKAISETTCFAAALAVLCARPLWEPLWLAALAKLVSTSMFMFFVIKASVMDFVKRSSVMSWEPVEALLFSGMENEGLSSNCSGYGRGLLREVYQCVTNCCRPVWLCDMGIGGMVSQACVTLAQRQLPDTRIVWLIGRLGRRLASLGIKTISIQKHN
jgi:hypothetical protein